MCPAPHYASASISVAALLQRADAYYAGGRYLEALSLYRDCLENDGTAREKASAYFGLGLLVERYLDDSEQALANYRRHIELGGVHSDRALHSSALILARLLRCNDSAACYRELLQRHPAYVFENALWKEMDAGPYVLSPAVGLFDPAQLGDLPGMVRVLIEDSTGTVEVKGEDLLVVGCGGDDAWSLPHGTLALRADNDSLYLNDNPCATGGVTVQGARDGSLQVNGRPYRSWLSVRAEKGRVLVVNHVCLEQYLYGVLPREVYVSWPPAALRAQAVAARTYALYHMILRRDDSYDVLSTTSSQAYGGLDREHAATNAAVDATRGLVLLNGSQLALTLYHANSGGVVEAVEDVWGARLPYLRRVLDTFSLAGRGVEWSCSLSEDEVIERLERFGIVFQSLESMQVLKRSGSGRVEQIELRGGGAAVRLSGNSLRLMLGPGVVKSTRFIVGRDGADFSFTGTGYGHGVGMSQWGARAMAGSGFDYQAILAHYYPGTHLAPWRVSGR